MVKDDKSAKSLRKKQPCIEETDDPELKAISSLPLESSIDAHSLGKKREVERIQLSRKHIPNQIDWSTIAARRDLTTEEIFYVFLALYDPAGSARKMPECYPFIGEIYAGIDSGALIPDLSGIMEWASNLSYKLFAPPCGVPERKAIQSIEKRNTALQDAATKMARAWAAERKGGFSKREIAEALSKVPDWQHMNAITIERLIRRNW